MDEIDLDTLERAIDQADDDQPVPAGPVRLLLHQYKERMTMAAEMGLQLHERTNSQEAEIQQLEQRINARDAELDEMRQLVLQAHQEKEKALDQLRAEMNKNSESSHTKDSIEMEMKSIRQKNEVIKEQLKEATEANNNLLQEIEKKNAALAKNKNIEKELSEYRKESNEIFEKHDVIQQQLADQEQELKNARKENHNLKTTIRQHTETQFTLENEIQQLKEQVKKAERADKGPNRSAQLQEAEQVIAQQEKQIVDLKWEKKRIEELMTGMVLQNHELQKQQQENLRYLNEARESVALYRRKEEENTLESAMLQFNTSNTRSDGAESGNTVKQSEEDHDSLLAELGKQLDDQLKLEKQNLENEAANTASDAPKAPLGAPKNCEEYFFLAVTSIRIIYAMRASIATKDTYNLNAEALYQQVLEAEIPFHEWYEWVKKQFERSFDNKPVVVVPAPTRKTSTPPVQTSGFRNKLSRMFSGGLQDAPGPTNNNKRPGGYPAIL